MAQTGSSCEANEKRATLKRKRNSTDDEVENMPPMKITSKVEEEIFELPPHTVVESSSCSSDDEGSEQPRSVFTDLDYSVDSFLSPPSIPDLPNCVLSPLENVARGECTPHSNKRPSTSKPCPTPPKRKCPLPGLSWADPTDVWKSMCECDARSSMMKNPNMFDNHPNLQPRMRAILLDWLNEVCEVYKLHRETFHLTVDYVDRYLAKTDDVQKGRLQLIGITCLFIAAKVEEVYPPKIGEFAYVTDGACTAEEILLEELLILKILSWSITPITINGWLNVYMQLGSEARGARRRAPAERDLGALRGYTFVFPQYSSLESVACGQLVDLAVLHADVTRHASSAVAAAAVAHAFGMELALRVSGEHWRRRGGAAGVRARPTSVCAQGTAARRCSRATAGWRRSLRRCARRAAWRACAAATATTCSAPPACASSAPTSTWTRATASRRTTSPWTCLTECPSSWQSARSRRRSPARRHRRRTRSRPRRHTPTTRRPRPPPARPAPGTPRTTADRP